MNDEQMTRLIAQIKLALSVVSGRKPTDLLTAAELQLLTVEAGEDALFVAETIVLEVLLSLLPAPEVDLRVVTVQLLHLIDDNGGTLAPQQVAAFLEANRLSDDFIRELEKDVIVKKSLNGLRWGTFAPRAIRDVEGGDGV